MAFVATNVAPTRPWSPARPPPRCRTRARRRAPASRSELFQWIRAPDGDSMPDTVIVTTPSTESESATETPFTVPKSVLTCVSSDEVPSGFTYVPAVTVVFVVVLPGTPAGLRSRRNTIRDVVTVTGQNRQGTLTTGPVPLEVAERLRGLRADLGARRVRAPADDVDGHPAAGHAARRLHAVRPAGTGGGRTRAPERRSCGAPPRLAAVQRRDRGAARERSATPANGARAAEQTGASGSATSEARRQASAKCPRVLDRRLAAATDASTPASLPPGRLALSGEVVAALPPRSAPRPSWRAPEPRRRCCSRTRSTPTPLPVSPPSPPPAPRRSSTRPPKMRSSASASLAWPSRSRRSSVVEFQDLFGVGGRPAFALAISRRLRRRFCDGTPWTPPRCRSVRLHPGDIRVGGLFATWIQVELAVAPSGARVAFLCCWRRVACVARRCPSAAPLASPRRPASRRRGWNGHGSPSASIPSPADVTRRSPDPRPGLNTFVAVVGLLESVDQEPTLALVNPVPRRPAPPCANEPQRDRGDVRDVASARRNRCRGRSEPAET